MTPNLDMEKRGNITVGEVVEIIDVLHKDIGYDQHSFNEVSYWIKGIAKFESYITDCPGYAGVVYLVIWSGAPEFITVLTVDRDEDEIRVHANLGHCSCGYVSQRTIKGGEK